MRALAIMNSRNITVPLGLGLFTLAAWAPVAAWLTSTADVTGRDAWRLAFADGRRLQVLGETVLYSLGVAALCSSIGSAAAVYCW